jgi:hypothetical protein
MTALVLVTCFHEALHCACPNRGSYLTLSMLKLTGFLLCMHGHALKVRVSSNTAEHVGAQNDDDVLFSTLLLCLTFSFSRGVRHVVAYVKFHGRIHLMKNDCLGRVYVESSHENAV